MYDINKLKELASMFDVEVDLYGEQEDKLTMSGTNGNINKFWEVAKEQGLLDKDPFDEAYKVVDEKGNKVEQGGGFTSKKEAELFAAQYGKEGLKVVRESYDPEETSWMDALIDTLRTYPSNDEIENDAFLKELRELYYKYYPNSDKSIEEETLMERMNFDTLYQKVKAQDRPIQEGLFGTLLFDTSFANKLYDEFYKPLTDLIKKGDKEGAMREWEDLKNDFEQQGLEKKKWARTFVEVQKARMEKYKAQIDALEDVKVEEPVIAESVLTEATINPEIGIDDDTYYEDYDDLLKEFLNKKFPNLFTSQELNRIITTQYNESFKFEDLLLDFIHEIIGDGGYLGGYKYWTDNKHLQYLGLQNHLDLIPRFKQVIRAMFVTRSKKKKINYDVSFSTCEEIGYEECPYLLGSSDAQISIGNRYELDEEELWATGWTGVVQNCNAGPFTSFDELDIYCYDDEKGNEYDLPEIPEDIKTKFLAEVNKYIEEVGIIEEGYKPHTQRILKVLNGEKLDEAAKPVNHWTNHPKWKTLVDVYRYKPEQLLSVSWTLIPAESKQMMDALSYDLNSFIKGCLSEGAFERSLENAATQIDTTNERKYNRNGDFDYEKYPDGPGSYAHLPKAYNYDPELDSKNWDFSDMPSQDDFFFKKYEIYYFETYDPTTDDKYEIEGLINKKDPHILSHRIYSFDKPGYFLILDEDGDCPYDGNDFLYASSLSELIDEFDNAVANNYNDYDLDGWDDDYDDDYDDEYDDYEESYTPISEDVDDDFEVPSYKAENTEFVMTEYISDSIGVESVTKVNDTTYKVVYNGIEVEVVFDFGWDEWVYYINRKGPFAHSSYEWIVSDIRNIIDDEPIRESYFEDEPSWLDEDPVDADREHANLYGGDRTYCDTCGSKLAMDEWGGYCPKCNPPELEENFNIENIASQVYAKAETMYKGSEINSDILSRIADKYFNLSDEEIEELNNYFIAQEDYLIESKFDTHSDIDLDIVGVRVANLLDVEALGEDNWIEFDCKDARGLIGTPDLHMAFEAIGSNKMLRGYMRAHTDGTIDVYLKNGSEGKFRNPEEIARFIAGEFGLSI